MADELPMLERIRANAEQVVTMASERLGLQIGYDERGVQWLDEFIQRQHEQGNPAIREGLTDTLGSYLGECIIQSFGGEWADRDGSWCVQFDERNAAYPFANVAKQLENGAWDSVKSFFSAIPLMFPRRSKPL